ncbi:MAG: HXXEE domain-containing protein [Pseudomonadota bacterium]
MTRDLPALGLLILAFAFLWLPFGQTDFLLTHWMKVGTFMAPFLLFAALSFRGGDDLPGLGDVKWMALVFWVAYIAHQFEEHWVDVYGRIYEFQSYLSGVLGSLVGADDGAVLVTREDILLINTGPVWLVGALSVWCAPRHVFPTLCLAAVAFVNAFSHVGGGLRYRSYNPGLLTSVAVFIPLGILFYRRVLADGLASRTEVFSSIGWSVGAHIFLFAGLIAKNHAGVLSEELYYGGLIALSILPVFMFRKPRPA